MFDDNQAPLGNGGAVAALPDNLFILPARTAANTTLSVTASVSYGNTTAGNGGALLLDSATGTISNNVYLGNHVNLGNSVYGLDSIINGSSASPVVKWSLCSVVGQFRPGR